MREIFDYCLSLLKSRLVPLVLVFVVLASVLVSRLFSLQIINGESYATNLTESIKKTTSVAATRGRILIKMVYFLRIMNLHLQLKSVTAAHTKIMTLKMQQSIMQLIRHLI